MSTPRPSRAQLKRQKKKARAQTPALVAAEPEADVKPTLQAPPEDYSQFEYAVEDQVGEFDAAFRDVFAKFQLPDESVRSLLPLDPAHTLQANGTGSKGIDGKGEIIYSDDEFASEDEDAPPEVELSKRKQRKAARLSVAELKRLVKKPEVVEWVDVSATDPKLLVLLKSLRNSVPIPGHWGQKRDYLQGKKGVEKKPFELPSESSCPSPVVLCCWSGDKAGNLLESTTDVRQASSPTRESRRSGTQSRRRRMVSHSKPRRASACSPRWARWTSTTKSCTMPSSSTKRSHP